MNELILALIGGAIAVTALAEILIASQKYQMKKQFIDELARDSQSSASEHEKNSSKEHV